MLSIEATKTGWVDKLRIICLLADPYGLNKGEKYEISKMVGMVN